MSSPSLPNFSLQKCPAPCLNVKGGFITASTAKKELLDNVEKQERRLDAAKLLIEMKMGLWMTYEERAAEWRNQAFHFKDEQKKLV